MTTAPSPLLIAGIGAGATLVGVALGAGLTYLREYFVDRRKNKKDAAFLAAIITSELESFSEACEAVAGDDGRYTGKEGEQQYRVASEKTPEFSIAEFKVEWRSLPANLMFDILDLPSRIARADRSIWGASEYAAQPPDYEEFFNQRQYEYAGLGIEAADIAVRLRQYGGLPKRPIDPEWDSVEMMKKIKHSIEQRWKKGSSNPMTTDAV